MNSKQLDLRTIVEDASKSSVPPLEHMCVIKCAIVLCNTKRVRDLLKCLKYPKKPSFRRRIKSHIEWQKINDIIIDILNTIIIPKSLKINILYHCFPVALEILKWNDLYQNYVLPEELCWTVKGTIDYKNTTKRIIKNKPVCIKKRFIMSCIYCLDTDIFLLWMDMSFEDKNYFINKVQNPIVYYWVITMYGARQTLSPFDIDNLFQEACYSAVKSGCLDAVKYFTHKLHHDARQTVLEEIFDHIVDLEQRLKTYDRIPEAEESDTWFFLFAHMTKDFQMKCLQNQYSLEMIFLMFCSSGRQKYLITLMNLASPYMESYHYSGIGFLIMKKYLLEYKDCNYRKTFIQFWSELPNSKRKFLQVNEHFGAKFLVNLLKFHFKFLLENGTMKSKWEYISEHLKSNELRYLCDFDRDKWKLLLFLIQDEVVTCRDVRLYKRSFLTAHGTRGNELYWKEIWLFLSFFHLFQRKHMKCEDTDQPITN